MSEETMSEHLIIDEDGETMAILWGKATAAEMRLPTDFGKAIEFVANSWWRRTLIKFISGGRIEFHRP